MRKHSLIAAALGTVLMTGAAFAATSTVKGVIKSIDTAKSIVTLQDGTMLEAPKGIKLATFKVGEKVSVKFDKSKMDGDHYELESMAAAS